MGGVRDKDDSCQAFRPSHINHLQHREPGPTLKDLLDAGFIKAGPGKAGVICNGALLQADLQENGSISYQGGLPSLGGWHT